jgi:hypothetical protein
MSTEANGDDRYKIWDRPRGRFTEAELYETLRDSTDPAHPSYDAKFDAQIRALRPDWFPLPTEDAEEGRA